MKTHLRIILIVLLCSVIGSAYAQFGPKAGPRGPQLGGSTARLFGENSSFNATLEMSTKGASADDSMTIPGKLVFDSGNSRFEIDMSRMSNSKMPPDAAVQMKSMGMDKMVMISQAEKKKTYMIYPGMQAYVENTMPEAEASKPDDDYKFETTELGRETVDGHPCIKNKAVVTDREGNKHESTIWNATDLKKFPIKIEQIHEGMVTTMLFKDISFAKAPGGTFEPPSGFARYDNMQTLMQQQIMKRMGGALGRPHDQ